MEGMVATEGMGAITDAIMTATDVVSATRGPATATAATREGIVRIRIGGQAGFNSKKTI